jgi:hypothetical protein
MRLEKERKKRRHFAGWFVPVLLILIGVVFLLEKAGILSRYLLTQWWPLILIAIGVWMLIVRYQSRGD